MLLFLFVLFVVWNSLANEILRYETSHCELVEAEVEVVS